MNSKQIMAIVAVTAHPVSVLINFEDGDEYEDAVSALTLAGCDVYRVPQNTSSEDGFFECACVNPSDPDYPSVAAVRLLSPVGHKQPVYDPDERIGLTPEGRLALRVIQGGKSETGTITGGFVS